MEFGELIEHEGAGLVCGCDTGRVIATFSHEQEADFFVSAYNEPPDLEIVQKALEITGLELRVGKDWILICGEDSYSSDDAVEVYYSSFDSLLAWAKQTTGIDEQ